MPPPFDRSRLILKPLSERVHDVSHDSLLGLDELPAPLPGAAMTDLQTIGARIVQAQRRGAAILLLMGAHVIRAGVARQLIDLMERGWITHIGMNGAGPIHDYELARIGATCESVARYIRSGEFGMWKETGEINDIVRAGAAAGKGLGEAIGQAILDSDFAYKQTSVLAAAVRLGVPVTVHIGVGHDIIHQHPNFDPAAFGEASYRDFLTICRTIDNLQGGVFLCMGSAVMGPEVYLKALSMARNIAHQEGRVIAHFTTAVFDLIPLSGDFHREAPKSDPQYYYRPWKTILVRTVADGGESFYVCGDHRQTVPYLRRAALQATATGEKPMSEQPNTTTPAASPAQDRLFRAQGCLLGQLAGDSLGGLVEFQSATRIREMYPDGVRQLADGGVWGILAGQPTDDSELALALARTIVRLGRYDPAETLQAYVSWYRSAPFDIGNTTSMAFGAASQEDTPDKALRRVEQTASTSSQANGSLMRISPLGIFAAGLAAGGPEGQASHLSQAPPFWDWARADSRLSHPHPICQDACAVMTGAIAMAIDSGGDGASVYQQTRDFAQQIGVVEEVLDALDQAKMAPPDDFQTQQGWVLIGLQNAFYQLLHATSLEEGIVATVMSGGDTDTNAAIAGALLGAVHGLGAVPKQWTDAVLACRSSPDSATRHPRPQEYWPVDALDLAQSLLAAGDRFARPQVEGVAMSSITTKDFGPIQDSYAFFENHSTEAAEDIRAYAPHLQSLASGSGPVRKLDFGCGQGKFSAAFLESFGLSAGRLSLSLVEPVDDHRQQAEQKLRPFTAQPISAWPELPTNQKACFDLVLANHVFYYTPDLEEVVTNIISALAPAGLFLTAIAGQDNTLIQFWNHCFGWIGKPVPFNTAEDLEAVLARQQVGYSKEKVHYELAFPDAEENRLSICRFLMGGYFDEVPRQAMLDLFNSYAVGGKIAMGIRHNHFIIK